jgi:hypothetical protein
MGQTIDPETLVKYQKTTLGNNPEDFMQHYDHSGSLQSHSKSMSVCQSPGDESTVSTQNMVYVK